MKFTINTLKLNSMLSKVNKGVGNGKILPVTAYVLIELKNNQLKITTTNLSNFITVIEDNINGEEGRVIVPADTLTKLIARTSKEEVTFKLEDTNLIVIGNGSYKIPIYVDEFPSYEFISNDEPIEIDILKLKKLLSINKAAIAENFTNPILTGYYIGSKIITTDNAKLCINNFNDINNPILITQELADLIQVISEPKAKLSVMDNKILLEAKDIIIFGTQLEGVNDYPNIEPILEMPLDSCISIPKANLINTLDRLALFTDPLENNSIKMNFKKEHVIISDFKGNSYESIEYISKLENDIDYTCAANIEYLKDLVNVLQNGNIKIHFGNDIMIRIEDEETIMILSLLSIN